MSDDPKDEPDVYREGEDYPLEPSDAEWLEADEYYEDAYDGAGWGRGWRVLGWGIVILAVLAVVGWVGVNMYASHTDKQRAQNKGKEVASAIVAAKPTSSADVLAVVKKQSNVVGPTAVDDNEAVVLIKVKPVWPKKSACVNLTVRAESGYAPVSVITVPSSCTFSASYPSAAFLQARATSKEDALRKVMQDPSKSVTNISKVAVGFSEFTGPGVVKGTETGAVYNQSTGDLYVAVEPGSLTANQTYCVLGYRPQDSTKASESKVWLHIGVGCGTQLARDEFSTVKDGQVVR